MKNFIKQFFKHKEPPEIDLRTDNKSYINIAISGMYVTDVHLRATINDKTIKIGDILCKNPNTGIGTMMMEHLIKEAKEKQFTQITGKIDKEDAQHIDKLKHFYGNFGFILTPIENDPKWVYEILLKL